MLEVANLTVRYKVAEGYFTAVDNVSFSVAPGERVAIVGESGSGKTNTCLAIAGVLTHPNAVIEADAITFQGTSIAQRKRKRLPQRIPGLAMVFQDASTSLDPVWTVGSQLVDILRATQKISRKNAKAKAAEWLLKVGMADPERVMKSRPYELSGGMRQRVMVALALSGNPRLLIADEPTSALDATLSVEIMQLLVALTTETGTGLILVTHDIHLGQAFTERMLVMYGGRIVEEGPSSTLDKPQCIPTPRLSCAVSPRWRVRPGRPAHHSDLGDGPARPGWRMQFPSTLRPGTRRLRSPAAAHRTRWRVRRCLLACGHRERACPDCLGEGGLSHAERTGDRRGRERHQGLREHARTWEATPGCGRCQFDHRPRHSPGRRRRIRVRKVDAVTNHRRAGDADLRESRLSRRRRVPHDAECHEGVPQERTDDQSGYFVLFRSHPHAARLGPPTAQELLGVDKSKADALVDETLAMVGIAPRMVDRKPTDVSGGQRQRIAIARSLVVKPGCILCDEVVSALDVSVQGTVLNLLKKYSDENEAGLIFVSHGLPATAFVSKDIVVMRNGVIVEQGSVDDVIHHSKNLYTKTLIEAYKGSARPLISKPVVGGPLLEEAVR